MISLSLMLNTMKGKVFGKLKFYYISAVDIFMVYGHKDATFPKHFLHESEALKRYPGIGQSSCVFPIYRCLQRVGAINIYKSYSSLE